MLQCLLFAANLKKLENLHSEELGEMPVVQLGRAANMKVELGWRLQRKRHRAAPPLEKPRSSPVFDICFGPKQYSPLGKKNLMKQEQGGGLRKPQG